MEYLTLPYVLGIVGIGTVISAISAWIPMARFFRETRKDAEARAKEEGKKDVITQQMRKDIDFAHEEIRLIKLQSIKTQEVIIRLDENLKSVVNGIQDIKEYLERGGKGCL